MDLKTQAIDIFGYLAAVCVFLSFCMKTMLSLRIVAILSNLAFIIYALSANLLPIMILHAALLPLNLLRLGELRRHSRIVKEALREPQDADEFFWLVPSGTRRSFEAGEWLFKLDDPADSLFVVVSGRVGIPEFGASLGPGSMFGEISLFTEEGVRTASARAETQLLVSELTTRRVHELYYDNPGFALRVLRLVTHRLIANRERSGHLGQAAIRKPQNEMAATGSSRSNFQSWLSE